MGVFLARRPPLVAGYAHDAPMPRFVHRRHGRPWSHVLCASLQEVHCSRTESNQFVNFDVPHMTTHRNFGALPVRLSVLRSGWHQLQRAFLSFNVSRWYVNRLHDLFLAHASRRCGDVPSNLIVGLKGDFKPTHQAYNAVSDALDAHQTGCDALK